MRETAPHKSFENHKITGGLRMLESQDDFLNHPSMDLNNWKDYPISRHSFQNVDRLIPIKKISGGEAIDFPTAKRVEILRGSYQTKEGNLTGDEILKNTFTDAFLMWKNGKIVSEYFDSGMQLATPHLAFSISKSITAIIAGIIFEKHEIDPAMKVSEILSGADGGAYFDATIQNLLDMTVSLNFDESYASTEGLYARYRRAMLWMPRSDKGEFFDEDLRSFVLSIPKGPIDHGFRFSYKSPNSDLIGLILEKITGKAIPELISEMLWAPLGCSHASITIDAKGMSRTAGGISCTILDLLKIGVLMLGNGKFNNQAILNPKWVESTFSEGNKDAWKNGDFYSSYPNGAYKNQWYRLSEFEHCAIGIHGQWIYINSKSRSVISKFSSQPKADDDDLDRLTLDFFRQVTHS
jgi:CubicO group peptidase (beta-lactamase class C family)